MFSITSPAIGTVFAGHAGRYSISLNERQTYYVTDIKNEEIEAQKVFLPKSHKGAK